METYYLKSDKQGSMRGLGLSVSSEGWREMVVYLNFLDTPLHWPIIGEWKCEDVWASYGGGGRGNSLRYIYP